MNRTLTVGGGGREHAMMLAFEQNGLKQYSTQANAGTEQLGDNLGVSGIDEVVDAVAQNKIDFVAIGPEAPLIAGLADQLRDKCIPVLGFNAAGAMLEGSKAFATDFATEYGILIPDSYTARTQSDALDYAASYEAHQYVIKADGEAGGKGVKLPDTDLESEEFIQGMMSGELFGDAGKTLVMQERLTGPEVSMFALFDGKKARVLSLAQDHKRLKDNDEGPNTGGMGAYSPVPFEIVDLEQMDLMLDALDRTISGMRDRDIASPGILYLGFMLAEEYDDDPVLMEYNVRFGDPEAQVVLSRLKDSGTDVHELFKTTAQGGLEGDYISVIEGSGRAALTVCLAATGYPDSPRKGDVIKGLDNVYPNAVIHHAGTVRDTDSEQIITSGGRVLYSTGFGESVTDAAKSAYAAIGDKAIHFDGMQLRSDIGHQAI